MEWLTTDSVWTLGSAACLAGTAGLLLHTRRVLRRFAAGQARRAAQLEHEWTVRKEHLERRIAELEEIAELMTSAPQARAGITPNTRGQALDMLRRGATPEQVSAALTIPVHEVRLLRTVQKIVLSQA